MILLWIGGDFSVRYALRVAHAYRLSTFFIGFFILSAGALIPDIIIAITAGFKNAGALSAGDVIGANFSDLTLVLGLSMLLAGTMGISRKERTWFLSLLLVASSLMLANFICGEVTRLHGFILIAVFIAFCVWVWRHDKALLIVEQHEQEPQINETISLLLVTKLIISFSVVLIGSMIAVTFAINLSTCCNMSLETIGATLMSIGTSLPELAVSLNALKRKEYGLALGPTLGTVLGQGTLILGILAVISPQPINLVLLREAGIFMFIAFIMIAYAIFTERLNRSTGVVLVSLFCSYLAYHLVPLS